jgi:3-dehydroquinate dehydratase-2
LGKRDSSHYGAMSLADIEKTVADEAKKSGHEIKAYQSNHEGALIDFLQKESPSSAGILINAGALTHNSYALHDALLDTKLPAVEVHLSDINAREEWRQRSVIAPACIGVVAGKKEAGYLEALELLLSKLETRN